MIDALKGLPRARYEAQERSWQGARRVDLGETGLAFLGLVT